MIRMLRHKSLYIIAYIYLIVYYETYQRLSSQFVYRQKARCRFYFFHKQPPTSMCLLCIAQVSIRVCISRNNGMLQVQWLLCQRPNYYLPKSNCAYTSLSGIVLSSVLAKYRIAETWSS